MVDKILSANGDRSFSSSRTTWRTSGTSCCVLKLKSLSRIEEIFWTQALRKLDGSTGADERFSKYMFREMDLTKGDNRKDSDSCCDHSEEITLNACKIELA